MDVGPQKQVEPNLGDRIIKSVRIETEEEIG